MFSMLHHVVMIRPSWWTFAATSGFYLSARDMALGMLFF